MISDRGRNSSDRGDGGESRRGFASMDEAKQREIASKGGKAAHEKGTAHEFTSEEARAAGRKGGEARGRGVSSRRSATSATRGGERSTARQR
ncbi:MAG TPA: KGG domain-containing protein [Nitrosospira sp.]|nr:KGG domain-containing protein [Nitrosospira sp.]